MRTDTVLLDISHIGHIVSIRRHEAQLRSYVDSPRKVGAFHQGPRKPAPKDAERTRIVECLKASPEGLIVPEIASATGIASKTVSARLVSMRIYNEVIMVGKQRKFGSSLCGVYRLVTK